MKLSQPAYDKYGFTGLISRIDLAVDKIRWMKSYESTFNAQSIEGLALNPAEDSVAAYARTTDRFSGALFVIRSEDGG